MDTRLTKKSPDSDATSTGGNIRKKASKTSDTQVRCEGMCMRCMHTLETGKFMILPFTTNNTLQTCKRAFRASAMIQIQRAAVDVDYKYFLKNWTVAAKAPVE